MYNQLAIFEVSLVFRLGLGHARHAKQFSEVTFVTASHSSSSSSHLIYNEQPDEHLL